MGLTTWTDVRPSRADVEIDKNYLLEGGTMGLDVYLTGKTRKLQCVCVQCGHEHTRKEKEEFFRASVTHNLVPMAKEAGIFQQLWTPGEIGISKARRLIEPLRAAIALMRAKPARFKKHNVKNGWGRYDEFVPWIERYLSACEEHPDANVEVSR